MRVSVKWNRRTIGHFVVCQFAVPRQLLVGESLHSMAGQLTDDEIARLWRINDVECAMRIRWACGIAEPEGGTTATATTRATATATTTTTATSLTTQNDETTTLY